MQAVKEQGAQMSRADMVAFGSYASISALNGLYFEPR